MGISCDTWGLVEFLAASRPRRPARRNHHGRPHQGWRREDVADVQSGIRVVDVWSTGAGHRPRPADRSDRCSSARPTAALALAPSDTADVGAVLLGRAKFEDALIRDVHPNLDVLPADQESMSNAGRQITDPWVRSRLIDVLDAARDEWDIVLVDTPGHQSAVVAAALGGSSGAIIPMVPEAGPVTALPTILKTIRMTADSNARLEVYGIIKMRIWGTSVYRRVAEEQIRSIADRFRGACVPQQDPRGRQVRRGASRRPAGRRISPQRTISHRLPSRRLRADPTARLAFLGSRARLLDTSKRDDLAKRFADRLQQPRLAVVPVGPSPTTGRSHHGARHSTTRRTVASSSWVAVPPEDVCEVISFRTHCTPTPVA